MPAVSFAPPLLSLAVQDASRGAPLMGDWVVTLIERLGYAGLAILMFAETVFPPLPSEVIMPLAGMQAGRGAMSAPAAIAAGSLGAMAGNILWFALARALGIDRLRGFVDRYGRWLTLDWKDVERGRRAMVPWSE